MQSELEWKTRCDLAALYRIFDLFRWTDAIFTHISARIPGTNSILMNPYGYLYEEVTASSLVKLNLDDNTSEGGLYNKVGYNIHSAIHTARPEIQYVMHTHTTPIVAVSSLGYGLEPCSQYGVYITKNLAYHDYEGIFFWEDEKDRLVEDLGNKMFCLMRNHGSLVLAKDVEVALFNQYILQRSCEIQIAIQSTNKSYILVEDDVAKRTVDYTSTQQRKEDRGSPLLWSAMKRKLDKVNPGYDQ